MDFIKNQPNFCIKYGAAQIKAKSSNIGNFIRYMTLQQDNPVNKSIIESMILIQDYPYDFSNIEIEIQSPILFRKLCQVNQKNQLVFQFGDESDSSSNDSESNPDDHFEFGHSRQFSTRRTDDTSHPDDHFEFGHSRQFSTRNPFTFSQKPSNSKTNTTRRYANKQVSFADKTTNLTKKQCSDLKIVHIGKDCTDLINWFDVISNIGYPSKIQAFYQMCKDQNIVFAIDENCPIPRTLYISFSADEIKKESDKRKEDKRFSKLKIPTL